MSYDNRDALPGETDEEYEVRARKESQAAMGLMFGIASLLFFVLKIAVIVGISFYAGFVLSQNLLGEETRQFRILGFALLFTYLIFCIIYFFKGTVIGLRAKNNKLWILPMGILCTYILHYTRFSAKSNSLINVRLWRTTGCFLHWTYLGSIYNLFIIYLWYIPV